MRCSVFIDSSKSSTNLPAHDTFALFLNIPVVKRKAFEERKRIQNQLSSSKLCQGRGVWREWMKWNWNVTYRKAQLHKACGTVQIHPTFLLQKDDRSWRTNQQCVWFRITRKAGKDWTPPGLAILSLLCKHWSLSPHATWVCLRGTQVLVGRKAEQGTLCGYSYRLQRQDSQTCIVHGFHSATPGLKGRREKDVQKSTASSSWMIHTREFTSWLSYMKTEMKKQDLHGIICPELYGFVLSPSRKDNLHPSFFYSSCSAIRQPGHW